MKFRYFNKKNNQEDTITFKREYRLPEEVFLKIDGSLVKICLVPHNSVENEFYEKIYIDYYDIEDILRQVQQVRDAFLVEENGELSGAFTISPKSYLEVDYHSLTMMGDEFDKKVKKLKGEE